METCVKKIWDFLQMTLSTDDSEEKVVLSYSTEELSQGYNLMKEKHIVNNSIIWPDVIVEHLSDDDITVNICGQSYLVTIKTPNTVNLPSSISKVTGKMEFYLFSLSVRVTEFDDFSECEREFIIDKQEWIMAEEGDVDAAQAVADAIAEQAPESLEIICKYMSRACDLGSKDAYDWLTDYYNNTDSAAEPYC